MVNRTFEIIMIFNLVILLKLKMINNIEYDDITMKDCCSNNLTTYIKYIRPHKRTYLEMLNNSNEATLNKRIDNYKLNKYAEKNINNFKERDNYLMTNFNGFNDINKAKKKFNGEESNRI